MPATPGSIPDRPAIELEHGITVYPARWEGDRWRAVWYEDGERQQCEGVSEDRRGGKLEKVTERLRADAPNMRRHCQDIKIGHTQAIVNAAPTMGEGNRVGSR
jgi:hypothetical protein